MLDIYFTLLYPAFMMSADFAPTANGQRPTANGQRPTANGQRPTANGQRPTANKIFGILLVLSSIQ
jgi:hypothetical protein